MTSHQIRDTVLSAHLAGGSMENLVDISEPQVPPNEQKDQQILFSPSIFSMFCFQSFFFKKLFFTIKIEKNCVKNKFTDLFAHFAELEVL